MSQTNKSAQVDRTTQAGKPNKRESQPETKKSIKGILYYGVAPFIVVIGFIHQVVMRPPLKMRCILFIDPPGNI
jgi:hypothetical protein